MKRFEGITLISDMDGTLLNDEKKIGRENREAIAYFTENGGNFSIASGRIFSRLWMYRDAVGVTLPVITMNGMMIQDFDSGKVLHSDRLPKIAKDYTKAIVERYPHLGLEIYTDDTVHFIKRNRHIDKHISDEGFKLEVCKLNEVQGEWRKVLFGCDENLLEIVDREFPQLRRHLHFTKSDAHFYEILGKDSNKGNALATLIQLTGIRPEGVVAVGDNVNDVEFINKAAVGVAVANACSEAKEAAMYVLEQNNNQAPIRELVQKIENGEIAI